MKLLRVIAFVLLFGTGPFFSRAQFISHGPVFGALTDSSVRMYIRTFNEINLDLQLLRTDGEETDERIEKLINNEDHSCIFSINGLKPSTTYSVVFKSNDSKDSLTGSFKTAPLQGEKTEFTFITGSCQETDNMKVFDIIAEYDPLFFLHTGDFTYPDYQIAPDYCKDMDLLAFSYRKRYQEKRMNILLRSLPIDYVYDDNDYVGSSGGRYYKNSLSSTGRLLRSKNTINTFRFPDFWRTNCINAYTRYFPCYELPDTSEGIYHSFVIGNAEFFFLDRNSAKTKPLSYAFQFDEKQQRWKFDPPEDYRLYEEKQMAWLRQGLGNSTANWKFIVSGVPFNQRMRDLIDVGIRFQNIGWGDMTGFQIATSLAYYWAAHETEYSDFMKFVEDEGIRDIIFISGDTHHNVMDNGENATFPEINASGLSVDATQLGIGLKMIGFLTDRFNYKKEVWNEGGNGLGNWQSKNAFGKLTVHFDEFVEISIIDEDNKTLGEFKVYHSSKEKIETRN